MGGSQGGSGRGFREYLPWAVAGIAVVALGVNLLWDRAPGGAAGDEAIAQLNERLAALEQAPAGPRPRPVAPPLVAGGADASPGGLGGREDEPQTPEQIAAERERQLRELEARFARDVPDPVTGPETENFLVETISGETMAGTGLRPSNVDIACKQASCRIVGSFDRMGDAQDWGLFYITAAGGDVLSQARMVFVPKPDGRYEVRIYSNRAKD